MTKTGDAGFEAQPGKQSMTFGSKMNHDNMKHRGGGFDNENNDHSEPPFV